MAILNYTTTVSAQTSLAEIQQLLAKHRVSAVMIQYDPEGQPNALAFKAMTAHGEMSFLLPANIDKVAKILPTIAALKKSKGKAGTSREAAARVAWRILKDWVEAQMAIIQAELVELEEVFLPFAQLTDGNTVYRHMKERGMLSSNALTQGLLEHKP